MKKTFKLAALVVSILLFISFWLPWVKVVDITNIFSAFSQKTISLTPFQLIGYANDLNKLAYEFTGETIWQLKLTYLYLLIPIISLVAITLFVIKKDKGFIITSIINSVIALILCLLPVIILKSQDNSDIVEAFTGVGIGYILTIIFALAGIVVSILYFTAKDDSEADINTQEHLEKIKIAGLKLIDLGKKSLLGKTYLHIGYLVFAFLLFIVAIIQAVKGNWAGFFIALILIGLSALLYFKMPNGLNENVAKQLNITFKQFNNVIISLRLPEKLISSIDNLIYVLLCIIIIDTVLPYIEGLSLIINILNTISVYLLFISVLVLLSRDKLQLALHAVFGYFCAMFIYFLKISFFIGRYANFTMSLKVLIYWSLSWYLLSYINILSTAKNEELSEVVAETTSEE
jgi:hypothetical protein